MIITKTPLRISLLGGNTDFPKYYEKHGGAVLTAAINKYVYCIVKRRFDDEIWINYSRKEKVKKVEDIKHDLTREAMKLVGVTKGVEITFLSDIPSEGSGLGSSSAILVGLLNALHQYKGQTVSQDKLANEACKIEITILKKPIGVQDQWSTALGGCRKLKFSKNRLEYVLLNDHFDKVLGDNLMLFYTGKTRKSEKILSKMRLKKKILDKNKALVDLAQEALYSNDLLLFSAALDEYWNLKKQLNKLTTNRKIDRMYKRAMLAGAIGGKIVGAGGGGFLLLVVRPGKRNTVRQALATIDLPFEVDRLGSRVIFNINE